MRPTRPSDHPSRHPGDAAPAPVRVVVAVGDLVTGDLIQRSLASLSQDVTLVSSMAEAVNELESSGPSLWVIDDDLPLVRGLDLAGRVRAERPEAQVVLMTRNAETLSVVNRLRVERLRALGKPLDLEELRRSASLSLEALAPRESASSREELLRDLKRQNARFEERLRELEQQSETSRPPPAATDGQAPGVELPDGLNVLVVDDDPVTRRALRRKLGRQRVVTAENGLAATRELEKQKPDVIVSDLSMPEMDGLALADEVQKRWPELVDRIVFVSGAGSQIERAHSQAPERPILLKPVTGQGLESRIAEVLEQAMGKRGSEPT